MSAAVRINQLSLELEKIYREALASSNVPDHPATRLGFIMAIMKAWSPRMDRETEKVRKGFEKILYHEVDRLCTVINIESGY